MELCIIRVWLYSKLDYKIVRKVKNIFITLLLNSLNVHWTVHVSDLIMMGNNAEHI